MKNTPNVAGKRYIFFIGTLAEFIKIFPIMKRFTDLNIPFEIIASGQNDIENSEIFSYLKLEKVNLKISGCSLSILLNIKLLLCTTLNASSMKETSHNDFK